MVCSRQKPSPKQTRKFTTYSSPENTREAFYNSKAKTEGIRRALQKFALKSNPYLPPVTKHYNQYNCGEISPFRNVVFQTKNTFSGWWFQPI